jgi:hypothetical protein
MAIKPTFGLLLASLFLIAAGAAQTQAVASSSPMSTAASRLAGDWRSTTAVQLPLSAPPQFRAASDAGAAPSSQQLTRMLLLLAPSTAQQQALAAKLNDLQNPSSTSYHRWLAPAEFAAQFANSPSDVAAVVAWLQSQGFAVAQLPTGRGWIEFSGSAAQVEQAFGTQVRLVATSGGTRATLAGSITVPAALAPLVQGLVSLDGVLAMPAMTTPQSLTVTAADLALRTSAATAEALTPSLMAQQVHLGTLQSSGVTGAGESIAIPSRSNVNAADVAAFRAAFGLPIAALKVQANGDLPGLADDQALATMAASWAGAAAPGAQILLVPSNTTEATDGLDLSLAALVDGALAHTVVVGYSSCEAGLSAAHQAFYSALYQQAAAEGIAVIAATGDAGASACTVAGSTTPVTTGYAVNGLASTPWNAAVGVAAFTAAGAGSSAKALAAWSPVSTLDPAYAGGGGNSTLYAVPSWQTNLTKAQTQTRLLPDLTLPTAIDSGANRGIVFCLSGATASEDCTLVRSGGSAVAAAIFGGIAALVAEQNGAQGSLQSTLYALASKTGVYTDVQQGTTQLACAAGTTGCNAAGQIGYSAAAGYDLATGLGAVNAQALVANWVTPMVGTGATTINMTVLPNQTNNTYNPSANITFTAQVLSGTGGVTPTGSVTFYDNTTNESLSLPITLDATGTTAPTTLEGVFALGPNAIVPQYGGDPVYNKNNSTPALTVTTQASTITLTVTPSTLTAAPGQTISAVVTLAVGTNPPAGTVDPGGVVTLTVDGGQETYTASTITSGGVTTATFPTVLMPANSALTTHTLQAVYPNNTDYTSVASPGSTSTINIVKSTPFVKLTPATNTPLPGASLLLTASISPQVTETMAPGGFVDFYMDGGWIGTSQVTAGSPASTAIFTMTAPALSTGTHTLLAQYGGDNNYGSGNSVGVFITPTQVTPQLTLTPATLTPNPGASDVLTATLAQTNSSGALPSGGISFLLDGIQVGWGALVNGTTATYNLTAPLTGTHTIQATYIGDGNFLPASSTVQNLTVTKIVTILNITPFTTTLAAGGSVQFNVTITPASYLAAGTPSNTVTFLLDGVTTLATVNVTQGAPSTPSTATYTLTAPSIGTHTVTATYNGDTYYATGSVTSGTITVAKIATTITATPATLTPAVGDLMNVVLSVAYPATTPSTLTPTGTTIANVDNYGSGYGTALSASNPATVTVVVSPYSAGAHTLTASYEGDTNFASSGTQNTITLNVQRGTPTVTLTPATTTPAAGSSLLLTASITPPGANYHLANSAVGTVTFTVDGVSVGSSGVVQGTPTSTATLSITASAIGPHTVGATYSGDPNYLPLSAAPSSITVSKAITTLTVTPASTTPTANSSMLVTATLASQTSSTINAGGNVTFSMDNILFATSPMVGTMSVATLTVPASGTHAIQAIYGGDSTYSGSTATGVNISVAKTITTTTITPYTTTPALGSPLPITVYVNPSAINTATPTGMVTVSVDGVAAIAQPLVSGNPATASVTLPALSPGAHTLTALFSGDGYYATSTSAAITVTVPKVSTTLVVTPSTTAPSGGASLGVSATITPTQTYTTLPTGTVSFTLDGVSVSSAAVVSGSPASASATLTATSLTPGSHVLAGVYSGDTIYGTSTAASTTITVPKSPTTTTVNPSTLTPTAGGSMTVTVDVTSSNPATAMPSGTVTLTEDGITVGTGTLAAGSPSVATITLNVVSAGSHVLAATYSGDTYYTTSNSSTVPIVAAKGASVTGLAALPVTLTAGSTETLTATVAPATPVAGVTYTLTGTVKFYDGATLLGTVPVSSNTAVLAGIALKDNINHTLTAVYSGDTNWIGSTSTALPLDATTLPDYVVLTSNYSVAPPGVAVVLTATVTPTTVSTTETNPGGMVIFYIGTTMIGQAALSPVSAISSSSVATLTLQTLPPGPDIIYAVYMGDDYYDEATSNNLSIVVEDFTITPSASNPATNLTIVKGSSGSASYDITGEGGFNSLVQVVCAVSSQDDMTCTASPQQVVPTGTVTFVVQTFTTGTTASKAPPPPLWPRAMGGTALATLGLFFLPFGRRVRRRLLARAGKRPERGLVLLLLLMGLVGAGVGCTNSEPIVTAGTPLGVATLKITATSYVNNTTISHSVYLTVNVITGT